MGLTNKLSAIGDAIRSKTGSSELLTLDQMPQAIEGITTGGGSKKAEGTFTLANDAKPPVITHNLGTTKIAVIIYPIGTVTPHAGYRTYTLNFINLYPFIQGQVWTLDFTVYNSGKFPEPVLVDIDTEKASYPRIATGQSSPWTTQNKITQGTFYGEILSGYTITDNTFYYNNQFSSGTYKYVVWELT